MVAKGSLILATFFIASLIGVGGVASEPTANTSYELTYDGTFRVRFAAGPGFTDELTFTGTGDGDPTGPSTIQGLSYTQGGPDGCSTIIEDKVTITTDDGTLRLENAGTDCIDLLSAPGKILIHGSGTTTILGGTGAYEGRTGSGTWSVQAEVTTLGPGHADGVFGPLVFTGTFDA